jgi:natural product precursor
VPVPVHQARRLEVSVKKSMKKLVLNKETLRNLNEEQLNDVAGGARSVQYSRCPDLSCGIGCTFNGTCGTC